MNLAGYIRVSTEGQVDAFGKEVQRKYISEWAEMNGHTIFVWYEEDAVSGKTDGGDRPALASILQSADRFDGIVAFDATRLARRLIVQETLLALVWAAGLRVFTVTNGELEQNDDDPTKILIRQILGVLAEFDHRTTVKKLQSGRKAKSAKGGYIGGIPRYGTDVIGTGKASEFIGNAVEASVVRRISELRLAYGMPYRQIADTLNDNGIRSKTGKRWYASGIQRIFMRSESDS